MLLIGGMPSTSHHKVPTGSSPDLCHHLPRFLTDRVLSHDDDDDDDTLSPSCDRFAYLVGRYQRIYPIYPSAWTALPPPPIYTIEPCASSPFGMPSVLFCC